MILSALSTTVTAPANGRRLAAVSRPIRAAPMIEPPASVSGLRVLSEPSRLDCANDMACRVIWPGQSSRRRPGRQHQSVQFILRPPVRVTVRPHRSSEVTLEPSSSFNSEFLPPGFIQHEGKPVVGVAQHLFRDRRALVGKVMLAAYEGDGPGESKRPHCPRQGAAGVAGAHDQHFRRALCLVSHGD